MTPVEQTIFGEGKGNCFSACIASALDCPLEEVPNFCPLYGADWPKHAHEWLMERGLTFLSFLDDPYGSEIARKVWSDVPIVASGKSPRGDFLHSVLWKNGELLHDPHFSKEGLVGSPTSFDLFLIVDAAKYTKWRSAIDRSRLTPELHAVLEFIVASYDSNGIKSLPTVDVEDAIDEILRWSRAESPDVTKRCHLADSLEARSVMLRREGVESVLPSEGVLEELALGLAMRLERGKVVDTNRHAKALDWIESIRQVHDWQRAKRESQG